MMYFYRNGGPPNNRIGNESIPSPGVSTSLGIIPGGPVGLYELNPESPGGGPTMLHHHHSQYSFTDMRNHPALGTADFPIPAGGRMSPPISMRLGGEGNNVTGFNYPGQDWPAEYPPCGPMPGYFPGKIINILLKYLLILQSLVHKAPRFCKKTY